MGTPDDSSAFRPSVVMIEPLEECGFTSTGLEGSTVQAPPGQSELFMEGEEWLTQRAHDEQSPQDPDPAFTTGMTNRATVKMMSDTMSVLIGVPPCIECGDKC